MDDFQKAVFDFLGDASARSRFVNPGPGLVSKRQLPFGRFFDKLFSKSKDQNSKDEPKDSTDVTDQSYNDPKDRTGATDVRHDVDLGLPFPFNPVGKRQASPYPKGYLAALKKGVKILYPDSLLNLNDEYGTLRK
ncbi:hypothetical protein ElyMa_001370600 [Elysia marginata]|uniref:Uncharacterized protein n=1 Tax=Elysia marginata TaxID=1093978 RepID=A0AAV4IT27_9GAST|nr:hypothetical protein ElyMa_001370600 [Elysia marginata]